MKLIASALAVSFILCTTLSVAQSILNGSFENNTFNGQYCNTDDTSYNEKMENSSILQGAYGGMGVFNQGCQLQFSDSIFGLLPPDGIWYIDLLGVEFYFDTVFYTIKRGISLKLSEPLNPNHWYRLSYYIKDFPLLSPNDGGVYESFVDSTGELTHPVIQTTSLEIGISDSESTFGSSIDTSIVPPQNSYQEWKQVEWIAQEVVFSPSFAAEHITCRPILPDTSQSTSRYAAMVDHFVLEALTSIDRLQNQLKLYPNPVKDRLYIEGEENIIIEVHDLLGSLHYTEKLTKPFINISHLSKGIYIVKVKQSNGQYIHLQNIIKS